MALKIGEDAQRTFSFNQLDNEIETFWNGNDEISYPIHVKVLQQMLKTTSLVGVKVENFNNLSQISVTWVGVDIANQPTDAANPNVYYALLDATLVRSITNHADYPFISARLGKHPGGEFFVFFNKSRIAFKNGGAGGVTDASGAVIR